jgi:hypothetical protein
MAHMQAVNPCTGYSVSVVTEYTAYVQAMGAPVRQLPSAFSLQLSPVPSLSDLPQALDEIRKREVEVEVAKGMFIN